MPDEHARLSASGSKKWLNCPASVSMEEKFPDTSSEYAAEGTIAHYLGELKICKAIKLISRVQYHKEEDKLNADTDMQEYTDAYKDFVIERYNSVNSKCQSTALYVEHRLDFSDYVPGGFGTGDVVIVGNGMLEIIDLKYGKGIKVSAYENSQLMLYALGALAEFDWLYDINNIHLTIFQPRIDNIDTFETNSVSLLDWGKWVRSRAEMACSENPACVAGKHCDDGFCKARPVCRVYNEEKLKLASLDFKKPNELTDEEIAEIIDISDSISKWAKTVYDYALDRALNHDVKYPGFKLVEGRSNRTYTDENKVAAKILENTSFTEDNIYIKKLRGISDMEKLMGKKQFNTVLEGLIIKPQGKPTLVNSDDKRPELNTTANAAEDFKNILKGD